MATYIADRYKLKKKDISGGNMASIHLCEDTDADEDRDSTVVVKLFNKTNVGDEDLQKQIFNREVESLEKLNHKNIVKILDRGYDENYKAFFIVLERIKGKNFKEIFKEICKYDYSQKLGLMEQVIEGIAYLHRKNIVHRDLKPSNLMLDKDGTVKIIDFGISKLKDTFYSDYTLAQFATKNYSSPEQMAGKTITYQSDIYSLGLIFYEIFTGSIIVTRETMDVSKLPTGMQNILVKMTKEEPSLRYRTISELKCDVEKERSILVQERYIRLNLANIVIKKLALNGYIKNEEPSLALEILEEEYSGKCYMWPCRDRATLNLKGFYLYGKRFSSFLVYSQTDSERFCITTITFISAEMLMQMKETAYEIPYGIKVGIGFCPKNEEELDAQTLGDEVLEYESNSINQRNNDMHQKDIINVWKNILELEQKRISQEKSPLKYNNLKINEDDDSLEIDINLEELHGEIDYSPDDMLQMTTRKNIHHYLNVGYMRNCSNKHMIIDLIPQADYSNIAESGEISISTTMADIAIGRKKGALKRIQFKENVNPDISDIIFHPEIATSKNNLMLTEDDCKSKEIDKSKLSSLEKALSVDNVFLLQGPPGTGKTTFISELVYQILNGNDNYRGNPDAKILIASQSHVAVDHSLAKIKKLNPDIKMIRIGILDKLAESSREYTLDVFCKEWTKEVIDNCKKALAKYKKEIGIDEALQEKSCIIAEIDGIRQTITNLKKEFDEVKTELAKVNILDSKWQYINDKIFAMNQLVSMKTTGVTEEKLYNIIHNFTENLIALNDKLAKIIDESVVLSERKKGLEDRKNNIDIKVEALENEEREWKELLGVSSHDEFLQAKEELQSLLKENEKNYAKYSTIENLCTEWQKRVIQGNGLLQESIADSTVIGATCLGIASLGTTVNLIFDWVIIDEAGKATPPEILVPICLGKKVVLVGDHKQLPPVVDEELLKLQETTGRDVKEKIKLTKNDLELSLFEYLENKLSNQCKSILDEQYRMNPVIGNLISELFYDNKLTSKTSRATKTIPLSIYDNKPLVWISTSAHPNRKEEPISGSYRNCLEAKIVFEQLLIIDAELKKLGLKKETAVIAGYRSQRDYLTRLYESNYKDKFHNMTMEINTVDAFQGRETDIVFYSIVRSNDDGKLGFLKDVRRLNVAFSRARELLVVVGDHQCTQKRPEINGQENPFIRIIHYIRKNADDCMLREIGDEAK